MADIFNEIDEDIRRDQLRRFWSSYGTVVLVAAFVLVAAVAGWRVYEHVQVKEAEASAARYYAAIKLGLDGDHKGAEAAFRELEGTSTGGYPVLAGLRAAAEQALAGDVEGAIKSYDLIAGRNTTPPLLAGAARIRAGYLAVDTQERATVEARIKEHLIPGDPWRHSAREIAALAAWKAGDIEGTRKLVDDLLNDAEVPRDFSVRAEVLTSLIRAAGKAAPTATQ